MTDYEKEVVRKALAKLARDAKNGVTVETSKGVFKKTPEGMFSKENMSFGFFKV